MLSHEKIVKHTAMLEIVEKPTRGRNHLDRIYVSDMCYKHEKVKNFTDWNGKAFASVDDR